MIFSFFLVSFKAKMVENLISMEELFCFVTISAVPKGATLSPRVHNLFLFLLFAHVLGRFWRKLRHEAFLELSKLSKKPQNCAQFQSSKNAD